MGIIDLYSYRKQAAEECTIDVLRYDVLPHELRVQIVHIWKDAIGWISAADSDKKKIANQTDWKFIHDVIAREHGSFDLADEYYFHDRCASYLLGISSIDRALDVVEVSFRYLGSTIGKFDTHDRRVRGITQSIENAVDELNERFKRSGVGFRFENGIIVRIDSELIHSEVVRPALRYLHQKGFEGPRAEFLEAHACYRAGKNKDAITNANNAFESTLKAICDQRNWTYKKGARASDLVKAVRKNGLLPEYLEKSFDQLAATLNSGLPKVRNEEGSHGQGSVPRQTPNHITAYALHLAAAKILFLVEAHKAN